MAARILPRVTSGDAPDGPTQLAALAAPLESAPQSAVGSLASRPTNLGASDQNYLYRDLTRGWLSVWDGSAWGEFQPRIPVVTAVPTGTGVWDGREVYLQTAAMVAARSAPIHLYCRVTGSTWRWYAISPVPLWNERQVTISAVQQVADQYQDASTTSDEVAKVTAPATGDYLVKWSMSVGIVSAGIFAVRPFRTVTTPIGVQSAITPAVTGSTGGHTALGMAKTSLSAGDEVRLRYTNTVAGASVFIGPNFLELVPLFFS